jgi:hypothetical protein
MAIVMNSQPQQQAHVSTTVMHYLLFILIEISFQQNKKKKISNSRRALTLLHYRLQCIPVDTCMIVLKY